MIIRHLALTLCVLVTLASATAPSIAAHSIFPDGTFETDANGPMPKAAFIHQENGNHFIRLQSTGPGKMATLRLPVILDSGIGALELSYRYRISDLQRGEKPWHDARIILNFRNVAGDIIGNAPPSYHTGNTQGWADCTTRFPIPKDAATLEFMPALFHVKSGIFDLDDIKLKPTDANALKTDIARNAKPLVPDIEKPDTSRFPPELFVVGNRLRDKAGREIWLQGVNIASLEWVAAGDHILGSTLVAINEWHANVIRLPVKETYWFGTDPTQHDGGKAYRELVDHMITLAANHGTYVVLDLHRFHFPKAEHIAFWKDAAARYRNHPAVLFDLFNEPNGISWKIWRDGGAIGGLRGPDEATFLSSGEKRQNQGEVSVGMQALVDAVRSTGAQNILVVGGLDYAYDLTGILNGYALDGKGGHGIMYASHIYPWKNDWQHKMLDAAKHYPILIGEVGADYKKQPWETQANFVPPETWVPDMLGLIQKYRLNWTGWCFHPGAGPRMIADWTYTPTDYWGVYAKHALAGEKFELKKLR